MHHRRWKILPAWDIKHRGSKVAYTSWCVCILNGFGAWARCSRARHSKINPVRASRDGRWSSCTRSSVRYPHHPGVWRIDTGPRPLPPWRVPHSRARTGPGSHLGCGKTAHLHRRCHHHHPRRNRTNGERFIWWSCGNRTPPVTTTRRLWSRVISSTSAVTAAAGMTSGTVSDPLVTVMML